MPLRLLVRAENSPTWPLPGSWAQGDIVEVFPDNWVFGNKETLPAFIRVRISNTNNADLGWLQEGAGGDLVNRRSSRMTPAEVEAVKAQWAGVEGPAPTAVHVSYTRAQFNSRIVTRVASTQEIAAQARELAAVIRQIEDQEVKDLGVEPEPLGSADE